MRDIGKGNKLYLTIRKHNMKTIVIILLVIGALVYFGKIKFSDDSINEKVKNVGNAAVSITKQGIEQGKKVIE
jgi:hypothetical protein